MKKLMIIVMAFACTQVKAQEINESFIGFKFAWNGSQNSFHNPSLENADVSFKSGFAAGAFCNIGLSEKFAIQPEFQYSQMGTHLEETLPDNTTTNTTLSLDYFSMPVLIKFYPIEKLNIFAGPQFDFLFDAKSDADNSSSVDLTSQVTSYDFTLTVGLEYWFTRYLGIYGRYMLGFQDINEKNPGIDLNLQTITGETTNTGFQVGLAIGIRSKEGETTIPSPVTFPAADSDGDGIKDDVDKCPSQAGIAKYNGCPIPDTDGDGVNDEADKCPSQAGMAKYNGCPVPDTDGDGVNDEADRCPKTAGIAGNMGCPEMILYYSREEAELDSNDMSNLDIVVSFMERHPDLNIIVEGHTSTPGDDAYNLTLSEKRANDAINYMVSKGVDRKRMTAKGMGEQFPIGDNSTDEGRAKSRRVVIRIAQ